MARVVYSPHYNIQLLGLERLHPFDSRKYGRAWHCLEKHFDKDLDSLSVCPSGEAARQVLLDIHEASYLDRLAKSACVAKAVEVSAIAFLPDPVFVFVVEQRPSEKGSNRPPRDRGRTGRTWRTWTRPLSQLRIDAASNTGRFGGTLSARPRTCF